MPRNNNKNLLSFQIKEPNTFKARKYVLHFCSITIHMDESIVCPSDKPSLPCNEFDGINMMLGVTDIPREVCFLPDIDHRHHTLTVITIDNFVNSRQRKWYVVILLI